MVDGLGEASSMVVSLTYERSVLGNPGNRGAEAWGFCVSGGC